MNIILAEIGASGELSPERSFSQNTILVGRDASECDIAFAGERYPMVSRNHAELRWQDGKWFVNDLNSSYGTYLAARRVTTPAQLSAGMEIQFGTDGPVIRVVWFEAVSEESASVSPIDPQFQAPISPTQSPVAEKPTVAAKPPAASIEFVDQQRPAFALTENEIWLGRESDCDVVFDAAAGTVSRKHASIRFDGGQYVLTDNNSFNGTFVDETRITAPVSLRDGGTIRLGLGGPLLRFKLTSPAKRPAPAPEARAADSPKTIIFKLDKTSDRKAAAENTPELLTSIFFADKSELIVGRDASSDIRLDGLQISNRHARLRTSGDGLLLEDLNSTNGVYVNGERVSRRTLAIGEAVQVGSFILRVDPGGVISVFDTRSKTRIDVVNVTYKVKTRKGSAKLLDGVSFSVQPNEFIGILGPSGAGKSTLIDVMNGVLRPSAGSVLVNSLDLHRNFALLKHQIGYVPQEDVIHRELSVYRTLRFIAKLRLSRDVSNGEISRIIEEVLDVTGLADQKDIAVDRLSGGQRKRVSTAVELLTKPSVIYLDEPTSGLDPLTEENSMQLFREIAESGRTVVMTTHAMESVRLFDKIVLLVGGQLVFYGSPTDALAHFEASTFKQLYELLEPPIASNATMRPAFAKQLGEELKRKFHVSPYIEKNVRDNEMAAPLHGPAAKKRRLGITGSLAQWITLTLRYFEVLAKDKLNLFILFAQAPLIALLTYLVVGRFQPRDFVYFVIALVAFWFGISVSAREIVRERAIYKRERMFNLGIIPYVFSKLTVLGLIVATQCLLLFVPLKFLDLAGVSPMPGEMFGTPQLWTMLLTAGVGIAGGLLVSAVVRTSELATSLVPLILIPQILFSGLVGVPHGVSKAVGLAMPSAWSFDTMKRFSTLDTLEQEGADPKGKTKGLGLYKSIEAENEKAIADARNDLEELKNRGGEFLAGDIPADAMPKIPEVRKIPDDLSGYVSFLHPWMNEVLNQVVLMLMLGILVLMTLIALRLRDHI